MKIVVDDQDVHALRRWAEKAISTPDPEPTDPGGQLQGLRAWAGTVQKAGSGYAEALITAKVRRSLYYTLSGNMNYGMPENRQLWVNCAADDLVCDAAYTYKDELKAVLNGGGIEVVRNMAAKEAPSVLAEYNAKPPSGPESHGIPEMTQKVY